MQSVRVERLDHLGIVAGICREIGLAEYLDGLAGPTQQQVSIGTATVAMILNGLGFSNRRLYLIAQFFATKPVEHLLGPGITAEMLHDDCLGRTLDWLHDHDPTALFADIARQARQRFGIPARQARIDTTSFAVAGEYDKDLDAHTMAVTYGYSRDHRADLKQWMLARATTRAGNVSLFCQALDGNASDKASLVAAVEALAEQLRTDIEEAPIFVADSGLYSAENVARLSAAGVRWISRVPDTSQEAKTALSVAAAAWQREGELFWTPAPRRRRANAGSWCARPRARSGSGRRSRGRWRRREPSGTRHCGIWGINASPVSPMPGQRSPVSSSRLGNGSPFRPRSSRIPSRTDRDAPGRPRRPTAASGRSTPR